MKKLFIMLSFVAMVFAMGCHNYNDNNGGGNGNGGNNGGGGNDPTPTVTTYTVTFNANGGTGEMQPQTFTEGVAQALTANAFTYQYHTFMNWNTSADGTGTTYTDAQEVTLTENLLLYAQWSNTVNGHEWVDLGLPSGKLWATCNVGASSPTDYGDYFAWGETTPQADNAYSWTSYKYANGTTWQDPRLTKYCNSSTYGDNGFTDTLTVLLSEDDAATANWGTGWRMPTRAELQELNDNCTVTWTTQNGVNGCLLTASNGNSLFLPAAGDRRDGSLHGVGSSGSYWSISLNTGRLNCAWNPYLFSGYYCMNSSNRSYGYTVRPVCSVSQK